MHLYNNNIKTLSIFTAASLVGPLLVLCLWPLSRFNQAFPELENFVYDLIFLLWPAQPLAVIESNSGTFVAATVAVVANILMFAVPALLKRIILQRWWQLTVYSLTCGFILLLAFWASGFNYRFINGLALLSALVFYTALFLICSYCERQNTPLNEIR